MEESLSRAEIDLLLVAIDQADAALRSFREDPAGFVKWWESEHGRRDAGAWLGGVLTDEERSAFVAWDYGALYGMGAHPSLLWQAVRALASDRSVSDVIAEYRQEIEPYGRPDFGT
jgi:hypothetical protein